MIMNKIFYYCSSNVIIGEEIRPPSQQFLATDPFKEEKPLLIATISLQVKLKAVESICVMISMSFDKEKVNHCDWQLKQLYEKFSRNGVVEILYSNLDQYVSYDTNMQILNAVEYLANFWKVAINEQASEEYFCGQNRNKFWEEFCVEGGQIKLERMIEEERDERLKD